MGAADVVQEACVCACGRRIRRCQRAPIHDESGVGAPQVLQGFSEQGQDRGRRPLASLPQQFHRLAGERPRGVGAAEVDVHLRGECPCRALGEGLAAALGAVRQREEGRQRVPLGRLVSVAGQRDGVAQGRRVVGSRFVSRARRGSEDEEAVRDPPHRESSIFTSSNASAIAAPASPAMNWNTVESPMKAVMSAAPSCHSEQAG